MTKPVVLTEAMTGRSVPDPLRHAFDRKTSAHSRGAGTPLPPMMWQESWNQLMSRPFGKGKRAAYFHIPFCRTKCSYCGFFQNTTKETMVEKYVDYLVREIEMTAQLPNVQSAPIQAVYFGGGTPTDLSAEQIRRLGKVIRDNLPLSNDCEMTFESRFNGLTDEKIDACVEAGFNRFSLGVQTFNSEIRRKMSRIDTEEVLNERLQKLMSTGQIAVVIDLIFGLPYQTMDGWLKDLDKLVESGIDGADLYQLILMGNTRMAASIEKGSMPEPANTVEKADMFRAGIEHLNKHHYRRLSVSHWGRTSRERNIYNHLSKSGCDVIPFGSGAGGNIAGHSMMLHRKLDDYFAAIDNGDKPVMGVVAPSSLYKAFGAAGAAFDFGYLNLKEMDKSGFDFSTRCEPLFEEWVNNGLAERSGHYVNLTLAGQFWAVNLNQGLQAYMLELTEESAESGGHMGGHHQSGDEKARGELEKLMAKMPKSMLDKMPEGHSLGKEGFTGKEDIPSGCPVHKLINWIRK
ncbi:heme anaerobic degradation radical SAM methyltransferase ChuW/HutW [Endozoicomonas euniceicola]|uniref:Heme anaerobic degradation radical SAM methyltransferase ChuW/HutW n=1 Tax=Endozoicomonas euniceicola TaxID=1234143 RepID=A0ABY6H3A0_9GAMM|nr:heme anaerobic degradation radical SAM methyltransferase ChuW/HutW [Endozoicomonas euniceicola]UYM18716.1 heme anaerobic degradation radical SAM methyltransferase ChuW/HutW [Endozoicomonas euniceicola]